MADAVQVKPHVGYVDTLKLAVSLCLTYTICIAAIRIWIRRKAFGIDDGVVFLATTITIGHTGTSWAAIRDGLGKPWEDLSDDGTMSKLNAASIAGIVTFLIALYTSKIGVLAFLGRITKQKSQLLGYYTCIILGVIFCIMSILIVTIDCPSSSTFYWAFHLNRTSCPSQSIRFQILTPLDVTTELLLLALPTHLVLTLQMPRSKKLILLTAFYLRAPVLALSLARNAATLRLARPASDPSFDAARVAIWTEAQLAYALAASTLSALKAFAESFNSGFGLGFTRGKGEGSYALSAVRSGSAGGGPGSGASAAAAAAAPAKDGSGAGSPELKAMRYEETETAGRAGSLGSRTESTRPLRRGLEGGAGSEASSGDTGGGRGEGGLVIMRETELSVRREWAPGVAVRGGEVV